ncbi:MAG: DNA internalization-related competence protein ComEC/Rec2 [Armatimonadota bacterium]
MDHARESVKSRTHGEPEPSRGLRAALTRRPLMVACLCLLLGTALAHLIALSLGVYLAAAALLIAAALALVRVAPALSWAAIMLLAGTLGAARCELAGSASPGQIARLAGARDCTIEGIAISAPDQRPWYLAFRMRVSRVVMADGRVVSPGGAVEARVLPGTAVEPGDRVRLRGATIKLPPSAEAPGQFDYRRWLARHGVTALASAQGLERIGGDPAWGLWLARVGLRLRQRVVSAIDASMPGRDARLYSRLLVGMVYGLGASQLPEEIVEEFRRAGTVHLLVVSGAQISMIALAILGLTGARRLRLLRWWQAVAALAGVLVLVLIVGMESSVARALAMFALLVLAGLTRRDYDVPTAIALSAAVICCFEPQALVSLSFQLTFAATLGVVLLLPRQPLLRVDGSHAAQPLPALRVVVWGTLGAWLMTAPLLAHSFAGFALSANLANLVNVPLSGLVMLLGFAALPAALVPGLSALLGPLCWMARALLTLVMHVNVVAAALPLAFVGDLHPGVAGCVAWYAAVAALLAAGVARVGQARLDLALLRLHPMWPPVAVCLAAALLATSWAARGMPPRGLHITVLPVGGGQCVVVRTPGGATLMADCGGGAGAPGGGQDVADGTIVPFLTRHGIERIDALVISHWDADHYNALPGVLAQAQVGVLVLPPTLAEARPPGWLRAGAAQRFVWARLGGSLRLEGGLEATVLAPRQPWLSGTRDDANNNSVVLMLRYGSVRLLLTGDCDAEGVQRLLRDARAAGWPLGAQVLLLPHHGRHVERTAALLEQVRPQWAIASCDWHAEEYLTAPVLRLIERHGARLLRTDVHGTITILTDGERVRVRTSRGEVSAGARLAAAER